MNWQSVFQWIESVPNVIWSGVIASIITLIGVLASNRGNTKRLHVQHQHEAQQKTKERITNIRRDICMAAASDLSAALAHLGTIPTLDPRKDNLTAPLVTLNSTAGRCQLIAEQETARLFAEVMSLVNELTMRAIAKSQPIFEQVLEAEFQQSLRDEAKERVDAMLDEQKNLAQQPNFNEQFFNQITELREQAMADLQSHGQLAVEALARRLDLQRQFARELVGETEPLVRAQIPLIVAMRSELELTTDINELTNRMTQGLRQLRAALENTVAATE